MCFYVCLPGFTGIVKVVLWFGGGARVLAPVLERAVFIMYSREEEMEQ